MATQIAVFRILQHFHHGPPHTIRCDRAYDNAALKSFCDESDNELLLVAVNYHEANGLI